MRLGGQGHRDRVAGADLAAGQHDAHDPATPYGAAVVGAPDQLLHQGRPEVVELLAWRADDGSTVRRGGIMGIVLTGGEIRPGDPITVVLPQQPHRPLEPV